MNPLTEAVARAICEEEWNGTQHWDHKPEVFKKCYRETADAAIAAVLDAMAEPSEGMVVQGDHEILAVLNDHTFALKEPTVAHRCWSAMLAAFREENT